MKTLIQCSVYFFFLSFVISNVAMAGESNRNIIESISIDDVRLYVEQGTLVVFDYDNVLIEGKNGYGFGDWFYEVLTALQKGGMSEVQALKVLVPIYIEIQSTAAVKLVEESARTLLFDLKNAGLSVMILTTRGTDMIDVTIRQLQSVGIDFEQFAMPDNGLNVLLGSASAYCSGILFGTRGIKGRVFKLFLETHAEQGIKKVIFINDKERYLNEVGDVVISMNLEYIGIRYGKTDMRSQAYVLDDDSALMVQAILRENALSAARA